MGSSSSVKSQKIASAPPKEVDPKKDVYSVWLLSSSDENLLQETINQCRVQVKATTIYSGIDRCMSYVKSLAGQHVILVASSEFMSDIFPKICSLSQVVSIISFYPFTNEIPSSISKNSHFAGSRTQVMDMINDDLERISTKEKRLKTLIHEETINRLLASLADVPLYVNYKKLIGCPVNYSISLRKPEIKLLRDKRPEICAEILGSINGKSVEVHIRVELEFIVDEPNNEIGMEIHKLNATEHSLLKDIDLKNYFSSLLKPIKIRGPMNMPSCLPLDMPDGQSQKILHVRTHGLDYEIDDHYIVLFSYTEFTVDPGH